MTPRTINKAGSWSGAGDNGALPPQAATSYRVVMCDELAPTPAGHHGARYTSVPPPRDEALALVRELLGVHWLIGPHGPWRRPAPGGQRILRLEENP